jgi:hypothetical protein
MSHFKTLTKTRGFLTLSIKADQRLNLLKVSVYASNFKRGLKYHFKLAQAHIDCHLNLGIMKRIQI